MVDATARFPQLASSHRLVSSATPSSRIRPCNAGDRDRRAPGLPRPGKAGTLVDVAGNSGIDGERIHEIPRSPFPPCARVVPAGRYGRLRGDSSRDTAMSWARALVFNVTL